MSSPSNPLFQWIACNDNAGEKPSIPLRSPETAVPTLTQEQVTRIAEEAWSNIAPAWPLQGMVASNPLAAYEDLPFEQAVQHAMHWWEQPTSEYEPDTPTHQSILARINRISIKWCQVFFDAGQAKWPMPYRQQGLFAAFRQLVVDDTTVHCGKSHKIAALKALPKDPLLAIWHCLENMQLPYEDALQWCRWLINSLPGWSAYVQYRTHWNNNPHVDTSPANRTEYLAMRCILAWILDTSQWPVCLDKARKIHQAIRMERAHLKHAQAVEQRLHTLIQAEKQYQKTLCTQLLQHLGALQASAQLPEQPRAQWVFCIDVRSEPFRRALEAQGSYQTFGYAGFFGLPIAIRSTWAHKTLAEPSCPVLLQPAHTVQIISASAKRTPPLSWRRIHATLKNNFVTPFALVETTGPFYGLGIALRSLKDRWTVALRQRLGLSGSTAILHCPHLSHSIPLEAQCDYVYNALHLIGLKEPFAKWVVWCGHGSTTANNPYASALDCGACGGRHGGINAQVLAEMANTPAVRETLAARGIRIPTETVFLAAVHNTTTDAIAFSEETLEKYEDDPHWQQLLLDLEAAQLQNGRWRTQQFANPATTPSAMDAQTAKACVYGLLTRSQDWSETRPEWGLARNAAFIIGPRAWTRAIDLAGRSFLHSYDWQLDTDGQALETILTAPLIVAEWINQQYLFSTWNPVAYGSGSKITHNVVGKFGIMQGNASDLMTGLSLQSVFASDTQAYHEPLRLTAVIYAPRDKIVAIVARHPQVARLITNRWIHLFAVDPLTANCYILNPTLEWQLFDPQAETASLS